MCTLTADHPSDNPLIQLSALRAKRQAWRTRAARPPCFVTVFLAQLNRVDIGNAQFFGDLAKRQSRRQSLEGGFPIIGTLMFPFFALKTVVRAPPVVISLLLRKLQSLGSFGDGHTRGQF